VWAVILAGGIGSRFWPMSTPERPKQLLPLISGRPLIWDTLERARALTSDDRIRILAGSRVTEQIRRVLPDLPEQSYLVEPRARGTCPALAWAASEIQRLDPGAVMVSLHADHLVRPQPEFRRTIDAAARLALGESLLVTLGVAPDRVETGFGHVRLGEAIECAPGIEAFRVAGFHEKPDAESARAYMTEGCLWNTGIFAWRPEVFLEELRSHAPDVAEHLLRAGPGGVEAFFDAVPSCAVDQAVLERSRRIACVRATFSWDDVGSWEALSRIRLSDDAGNVLEGPGSRVVDGHGNIVVAEEGRLVLFGTDDLVVVRSGETTLVTPRARAGELKALLKALGEAE
jgi:mannose-1-phosphate guanylyltransferase